MKTVLENLNYSEIANKIKKLNTDTILFVVDEKVWSYHQDKFDLASLREEKTVHMWIAPRGEEAKRMLEFEKCIESFLEKGVHRNTHLIALGGGALSDFAGFVASSLLRGISWSIIPTTLLSMVDASIGGKVALNSRYGKNLIGSFHLPENVWVNTDFLKTLPKEEMLSGYGEIIKYTFLSKSIFDMIMDDYSLDEVIQVCAKYKLDLTELDFQEQNVRKILNLGHTLGHALEKAYSLKHGIAVFWGLVLSFHLFYNGKFLKELRMIKDKLGWEDNIPPWSASNVPIKRIVAYMEKDKKLTRMNKIDLVYLNEVGQPVIKEYTLDELIQKIKEALHEPTGIVL